MTDLLSLLGMLVLAGSLYFAWSRMQQDKKIASITDEKEKEKAQQASRMTWLNIVLAMVFGGALIWLGNTEQENVVGYRQQFYGYTDPYYNPAQQRVAGWYGQSKAGVQSLYKKGRGYMG